MNGLLSDRKRLLALGGLLFAAGILISVAAGVRRNGTHAPAPSRMTTVVRRRKTVISMRRPFFIPSSFSAWL